MKDDSVDWKTEVKFENKKIEMDDPELADFKPDIKVKSSEDVANQGRPAVLHDHRFMGDINKPASHENALQSAPNDLGITSIVIIDLDDEKEERLELASSYMLYAPTNDPTKSQINFF